MEKDKREENCKCNDNYKCHEESHNKKCNCKEKKHGKKEELDIKIKTLEEVNQDLIQKVQYAQAELINYRKRKDEEIDNYKKYCNQDIIMQIIPVIDNFERAIKLDDEDLTDEISKFLEGFKMMYATLCDVLKNFGVEEISRVGEVFDPNLEEALITDDIKELDDDVVVDVLLKGYKLKDRVIRAASVKINKKSEGEK